MQKIYLNIRGLKNFATDDLMKIQKELPFEIYPALFWESLSELKKIGEALQKAIKETDALILENHLKGCVVDHIQRGETKATIDEIMKIFRKQ